MNRWLGKYYPTVCLLLLITLAGSCGKGSIDALTTAAGGGDLPSQLADENNLAPEAMKTVNGFGAMPVDFNTKAVDYAAASWFRFSSAPVGDEVVLTVSAENAVDLSSVFYQVVWPRTTHLLDRVETGTFFAEKDILAYDLRVPGVLDVGHSKLGHYRLGGNSGSRTLAVFHFKPGDGLRQLSAPVQNQADGDDVSHEYNAIFSTNRRTYYDGVGYSPGGNTSGDKEDGVIFQSMNTTYLDEDTDMYFDPQTFMFNVVGYLPGDYDQNGETNISDITPLAGWHDAVIGSAAFPSDYATIFGDPLSTLMDERNLFIADPTDSILHCKWVDGNYGRYVNGVVSGAGVGNDLYPIIGYANTSTSHQGERVQSLAFVVSSSSTLGGQEYTLNGSDRVVILGDSSDFPYGSNGRWLPKLSGSDYDASTYGYRSYTNAPWNAENDRWPLEFAGVMNPDLLENWGSGGDQSNGVWNKPASAAYLYAGTLAVNNAGTTEIGVLTPYGSWSGTAWAPINASTTLGVFDDSFGLTPPRMVPVTVPSTTQGLPMPDLRKNYSYSSGVITAVRDSYNYTLLDAYDWETNWGNAEDFQTSGQWAIEANYPRAYDISGVTYEFFIANAATYETTAPFFSFFSSGDTAKATVGRTSSGVYTTKVQWKTYNGAGLVAGTKYYVMIRPKDAHNARVAELSVTDSITLGSGTDTTPPTFAGITSAVPGAAAGQITVTCGTATELRSFPVTYNYWISDAYASDALFIAACNANMVPCDTVGRGGFPAGTYTASGLTGGNTYRCMMRANDYVGNIDTNVAVLTAVPAVNVSPVWDAISGVRNVQENGSGSVKVYFDDADDAIDGVQYGVFVAPRTTYDTADLFLTAVNAGSVSPTWVAEGSVGAGAHGYAHSITVTSLTDEAVYWFAVRTRDNTSPYSYTDSNMTAIGCRPSAYSWDIVDTVSNYTGYFPDISAIDYDSGDETRVGISYLTMWSRTGRVELTNMHSAREVKYAAYDTDSGTIEDVDEVTDYDTDATYPALGETSVCFLDDRARPALVYFASNDSAIADADTDSTSTRTNTSGQAGIGMGGMHGGSANKDSNGSFSAVQYGALNGSTWELDTVDTLATGNYSLSGRFNSICPYTFEQPGTEDPECMPFVGYSASSILGGPQKVRFLSREDGSGAMWWRPFYDAPGGSVYKDSVNAEVLNLTDILHDYGVDLIVTDALGSDKFVFGTTARDRDYEGSVFGVVSKSAANVVDYTIATPGWGYQHLSTPTRWDEWSPNTEAWFMEKVTQTGLAKVDNEILGYKMASYDTGSSSGFGVAVLASDGVYYISDTMSDFETVETFTGDQAGKYITDANGLHDAIYIGLAFDSDGTPGVVYPRWNEDEDGHETWTLRVKESVGGGSWSSGEDILYNDEDDLWIRQAAVYDFAKIAYLHNDKWFVITQDWSYRAFASESGASYQKLLYMVEP